MLGNLRRDAARLASCSPHKAPWYVIEALLFDSGFQAVVFYRLARWFKRQSIPFFGPFIARLGLFFTGVEISPGADIGPGLRISHGTGLVVGGYVRMGEDVDLLHGVTVGSPSEFKVEAMPRIGDRVFIAAGATLIGDIEIGSDTLIAAGALVTEDIPPGSKVLSAAGIQIKPRRRDAGEPPPEAASGTEPPAEQQSATPEDQSRRL